MTARVHVACDSVACAVGADALAETLIQEAGRRGMPLEVVRTSCRGLYWLEPLVEVDTAQGRVAYGPVPAGDVASLFDAGFLDGGAHPARIGDLEQHPFLARQQRLVFARAGLTRPLSLSDYLATGGYAGLQRWLSTGADAFLRALETSGLRGRGGAAFPAHIKWQGVRRAHAVEKFVVCNADEGDSGTFADRMLLEGDPYALIEGMTLAALTVGARQGYVYIRSEYPRAIEHMREAIAQARQAGYLGDNILGNGQAFELEVRCGAGAYICGEESALLESIEGRRGMVRPRPPLPSEAGLFGQPTLVHNVMTLAAIPFIAREGGEAFSRYGSERSRGTLAVQLAGNLRQTGLVETAFGLRLSELLHDFGGGSASGRPIKAVQIGGPLGAWVAPADFDLLLDYEAFVARGALVGHGGVVAVDDRADLADLARLALHFCAEESCGKCTPCRVGTVRAGELVDRIRTGLHPDDDVELLTELCQTMRDASLCALGGMVHFPVLSALRQFPRDFGLADRT
ncbi:formate dehydrogenase [Laribacter hongkongensis]|uniref:formate dehydrogenase beta subunit n=1 Tax=Laribacter hongkongensis TaxID=168471 RepID=UPI001EFDACD9|nr:formate dehydrogenase beta subunit [Laribacter hongkongensis]MCG9114290.1 formate dehydrogenase [Laribacter hongkongensis]